MAKKNFWELFPEEMVYLIDPSLKYIKTLNIGLADTHLVRSKRGLAVLKNSGKLSNHVHNEKKALEILVNVEGIPRFYTNYKGKDYFSILKEYISGKMLREVSKNFELQRRIKKLFSDIIENGVTVDDPHDQNIVVTESLQPYLIDFGLARFKKQEESLRGKSYWKDLVNHFYNRTKRDYFPEIK